MGILKRSEDTIVYDFPGMTRFEGLFGVLAVIIIGGFWIYYGLDQGDSPPVITRFLLTFFALSVALYVVFRKNLVTGVLCDKAFGEIVIYKGLVNRWLIKKSFKIGDIGGIAISTTHYYGSPGVYLLLDNKRAPFLFLRKKYFLLTETPEIADEVASRLSEFTGIGVNGVTTNLFH
jgi:hypothetical protein